MLLGFRHALAVALLFIALLSHARVRAEDPSAEYAAAVQLGVEEFEAKNFLEARTHLLRAHGL